MVRQLPLQTARPKLAQSLERNRAQIIERAGLFR